MKACNERTKAKSIENFNGDVAMKGDLDLALHWDRAAPAFQEMVHIGPGSLKFARRSRLYICMYVFMYYACMYVCMYVFMYVCLYISSLRPRMIGH